MGITHLRRRPGILGAERITAVSRVDPGYPSHILGDTRALGVERRKTVLRNRLRKTVGEVGGKYRENGQGK